MTRPEWVIQARKVPVVEAARRLGMSVGRRGGLGPCPRCSAEKRGKEDRRPPVGVRGDGQGWRCHACDESGDVLDLVACRALGADSASALGDRFATELRDWFASRGLCGDLRDEPPPPQSHREPHRDPPARGFDWTPTLVDEAAARLWTDAGRPVLDYLQGRGFAEEALREHRLGAAVVDGEPWVTIPLCDPSGEAVNVKWGRLPGPDGERARPKYRACKDRPLPLFGGDRLGNDLGGPVVVVEGELDAVALWQLGLTVSVVSSTGGAGHLADDWLDLLEPYESFVLCYDQDEAGEKGRDLFVEKMGAERCSLATLPCPDAADCLREGVGPDEVAAAIDAATSVSGIELLRVSAYESEIERLIESPGDLVGITTGLERLDALLAGWRPGLVILTGGTGEGKTTWAAWAAWEQAHRGVPTLLTSFEPPGEIGVVQKLLRMQLGCDFTQVDQADRRAAFRELGRLPLRVAKYKGNMQPDVLCSTLGYAVRRQGVRFIVVDHLGFVVDRDAEDERRGIESTVRALTMLADHRAVTVVLVCHPGRYDQRRGRPILSDLKGASAIEQDASDVIVVQRVDPNDKRDWPAAWLHVDKCRSDFGSVGKAFVAFGPTSCRFSDRWQDLPEGGA